MADSATLAKRLMFEYKWTCLFAMALSAVLILPRHGQAARRLENIRPVRIVALHAIHASFNHWMALGQMKFCLRL